MINVQGLKKAFKKGTIDEKVAMDGVDLDIPEGQFVTVIGSNGAGKSTLLNLISGTVAPDEGEILLDGNRVTELPEHRRAKYLGRIFQDPLLGTAAAMTNYPLWFTNEFTMITVAGTIKSGSTGTIVESPVNHQLCR